MIRGRKVDENVRKSIVFRRDLLIIGHIVRPYSVLDHRQVG